MDGKVIAITMGDPAGVGPEVILRAFADDALWKGIRPVVYGDLARLRAVADEAVIPIEPVAVGSPAEARGTYPRLEVVDFRNVAADLPYGAWTADSGRAAVAYIEAAAKAATAREVAALVTAPISKEAIRASGSPYTGHTDMLAAITGCRRYAMTLVADDMRAMFVTAHIPIAEVPAAITQERVRETIELAAEALTLLGEPRRMIAVAGLNPHAGEAGMLGQEELEAILPAIKDAQDMNINCVGPVPSDTVFLRMKNGEFGLVVAMYHDQGHAPLKLVAFDTGVNWTVGLPIVRTSPDHGTAFDIAGKWKARPDSMRNAVLLAARVSSAGDRRKR
jgi:4-hydroxythreonine-4-phosphate dehydrogenase